MRILNCRIIYEMICESMVPPEWCSAVKRTYPSVKDKPDAPVDNVEWQMVSRGCAFPSGYLYPCGYTGTRGGLRGERRIAARDRARGGRRDADEARRGAGVVPINQIDWCDVERSQRVRVLPLPLCSLSLCLSLSLLEPLHSPRQYGDRPYTTCPIANPFNSFLAV